MKAYQSRPLSDFLRALSTDMHQASGRPCQTCRDLTSKLGYPFGCYEYQAKRNRRSSHGLE